MAFGLALTALAALLAGCGGSASASKPTLTWYINPDPNQPTNFKGAFGQAGIAQRCSTDRYTITTQELPGDASQQRIQLARRLAAKDPGIDLMSLDPVFTAEFSNAGFLAPVPAATAADLTSSTLKGAVVAASFRGKLVVSPLWANTQLLWYRKSFAAKAGLDMSKPVTWAQIIDAAAKHGGTVGVQANKYEGYAVWINALVASAGGTIVTNTEKGANATVTIDSPAGRDAAAVISKLAHSPAAEPDLSVSNEGTVLGPFATDKGAFQVNWTFTYGNYAADKATQKDIGWAPYPETVAGRPAKGPLGGINIGVSAYSHHVALANEAVKCMTNEANQVEYAAETGNMPARAAAYHDPKLEKLYPAPLLAAFSHGIATAGPRPVSAYWSDISSALQSTWHPANSVTQQTPASSKTFIEQVLQGKKLL